MDVATDPTVSRAPGPEASGIPYTRGRDRNTPWIVFGVLLATLGGLGAFLVATTLADRVDVVVAARDVEAGEVLTADDLGVVEISGGDGARAIAGSRVPELVGSASRTDLVEGAILHPDQIVEAGERVERTVIIGAALLPGEYPLPQLLASQVVQVVEVSGETGFSADEDNAAVLGKATIVSVQPLTRTDELLVSMRVEEGLAPVISERAQQRRIRLVLVEDPDEQPSSTASTATPRATTTTSSPLAAQPAGPNLPAIPPVVGTTGP